MKTGFLGGRPPFRLVRGVLSLLCAVLLVRGDPALYAQQPSQSQEQEAPKIPNDQLDSLVAPIALYPDPLLAQMLAASTYPLEVIQLQQWLLSHKDLKGDALVAAVQKEDWDASVQAMAGLPDAVKQLAENIKWTTELGNAFLAQQGDVMDAVQRMRKKAQDAGSLKSTEQQKVETQVVETKTVVVIQQANPQVVYVPSYNPVVVYGPPVYPYPPIVYPPPPPPGAVMATAAISFGVGMAIGAAASGGWGYNCGWGGNNTININNSNTFVNNSNKNFNSSNINTGGNNNWQHNPQHRAGAPYSNQATAAKYSGANGGARAASGQGTARQTQGQSGTRQQPTTSNLGAASNRQQPAAQSFGGSSADRAGSRSVPSGGASASGGAFGGGSSGFNGSSAKTSGARGSSSMAASRSGGGRRR
jgi:hypothetical protein